MTRFVIITDTHGNELDQSAWEVASAFVDDWKSTIRVHLGDAFNLSWLRSKASEAEKMESVGPDLEAGIELLRSYKPTHMVWGNHDHRMFEQATHSPYGHVRDHCQKAIDDARKALKGSEEYFWGVKSAHFKLADYSVVHGYANGIGATRQMANAFGNVIHGHNHRNEEVRLPRVEPTYGYSVGCLCRLDMEYARGTLSSLAQEHGFAYGVIDKKGKAHIWLARPIDGVWMFPSEMREQSTSERPSKRSASKKPTAKASRCMNSVRPRTWLGIPPETP